MKEKNVSNQSPVTETATKSGPATSESAVDLPDRHVPAATVSRSATEEEAWSRLLAVLAEEHPVKDSNGSLPQVFLRPEATFSFRPEVEDEDFSAFHVETLLDQAADLLDRSVRDRLSGDDLVAQYATLLLELHEFKDLDRLQIMEEAAGMYEVPSTEAVAARNVDRVWNDDLPRAVRRAESQEAYFDDINRTQYVEHARRQGFATGVPAYFNVGQALGEYPHYDFTETIQHSPDHVSQITKRLPVQQFAADAAEYIAERDFALASYAILDRRKEAEASRDAAALRLIASEARATWEEQNRQFRRQRTLVTRTYQETKMRYATDPDGVLNYGRRILDIHHRIHQDFRYAIARVTAAAKGLRDIYGYTAPFPSKQDSIDEWLLWTRSAINWLVRFSHRDQDIVIPISLRTLMGQEAYAAGLKQGEFTVPQEVLPQGRHVRLRGISGWVAGKDAAEHLWRFQFTAPALGVFVHRNAEVVKVDQSPAPPADLARVTGRSAVRQPDVAGLVALRNLSPFGEWSVQVLGAITTSTPPSQALEDIFIELHLSYQTRSQ